MSHIEPLRTMTKGKTQKDRKTQKERKDRKTQVRKRTKGLIKKAHQLAALTGVKVAVFVEDPEARSLKTYRSTKQKSFPPTPEQVALHLNVENLLAEDFDDCGQRKEQKPQRTGNGSCEAQLLDNRRIEEVSRKTRLMKQIRLLDPPSFNPSRSKPRTERDLPYDSYRSSPIIPLSRQTIAGTDEVLVNADLVHDQWLGFDEDQKLESLVFHPSAE